MFICSHEQSLREKELSNNKSTGLVKIYWYSLKQDESRYVCLYVNCEALDTKFCPLGLSWAPRPNVCIHITDRQNVDKVNENVDFIWPRLRAPELNDSFLNGFSRLRKKFAPTEKVCAYG
jgi:hypothetical protein